MNDQERFKTQCGNDGNPSRPIYELGINEVQQVAGGMKNPVRVVITGAACSLGFGKAFSKNKDYFTIMSISPGYIGTEIIRH
jgi:hypothetical protein